MATSGPRSEPLMIEGPKPSIEPPSSAESPIIDVEPQRDAFAADESLAAGAAEASDAAASEPASRWRLPSYAPLAAGIAFAIALGAAVGAAATSSLVRAPATTSATADATRALQDSVTKLSTELATLKSGIVTAQRTASTQYGKLAERLDRSEKAMAEPTAKLAKIQETVDRLDHRQQQAAVSAAPDVTGSVTPKEEPKPVVAEGWRLRDYYAGRAVIENRAGTLFEVAPGSNLPGLGKVEAIRRENGNVVVVTRSGIIAASLEQRRPDYRMPYRYY